MMNRKMRVAWRLPVMGILFLGLMPGLTCKRNESPVSFKKTFGGTSDDAGLSGQQTSDGGYITAGYTCSYGTGGADMWLIKTDTSGDEQWDTTFGGVEWEEGNSVQQTSDGGYIVAGWTASRGMGGSDVWLVKTDASGHWVWDKTFGGTEDDLGYSVQQTADGGYVIAGYTHSYGAGNSDAWLIKTDASGNKVWDQTFGWTRIDGASSVQQTSDGGYIMTGWTNSFSTGDYDAWLVKTDSSGNKLWDKTFGGTSWDQGYSVQQTSDGGYIITGLTASHGAGGEDAWLIKTDTLGNEVWDKTFGGAGDDEGRSVKQTSDGGYIIAGSTAHDSAASKDVWLIKTDALGNKVWDRTFGGAGDDAGYSVQQTADGGYVVMGSTASLGAGGADVWLIKTDADGN